MSQMGRLPVRASMAGLRAAEAENEVVVCKADLLVNTSNSIYPTSTTQVVVAATLELVEVLDMNTTGGTGVAIIAMVAEASSKFCDTIREPQQRLLGVEQSPSNLKNPYTDNGKGQDSEILAKLAEHNFRSVGTQHSKEQVQDRVRSSSTLLGSQRNPSKQWGFSGRFIKGSPNTPLNAYIIHRTFRMETLSKVIKAVKPVDWLESVDLQDAYMQIPIHPKFQKFLRFKIEGQTYQYKVLPFGLASAP